jgi:hypothetical protein
MGIPAFDSARKMLSIFHSDHRKNVETHEVINYSARALTHEFLSSWSNA